MIGVLGNFSGVVKPWYLPLDFVFCRVEEGGDVKVKIIRNSCVSNIYGAPVEILGNKVVRIFKDKFQAPPPYAGPKPGLEQGATYQCQCGAQMTIEQDNIIQEGWQFWHWQGNFKVCCPAHHTDVMALRLHKDLYKE